MSHKKIMQTAAKKLESDAKHYAKEAKEAKSPDKKEHEKTEMKEAAKGASVLKKMVKKAGASVMKKMAKKARE